jgi:hypothetical protein
MSTVQTQKLAHPNDTNAATIGADGVVDFDSMPTVNGVEMVSSTSGEIVQMRITQFVNRSAHIYTNSTTFTSTGVSVSITPKYANSTILVSAMSGMGYGRSGGRLLWALHRSGAGVTDGYIINKTTSYSTDYYHSWIYADASSWQTLYAEHLDTTHNTTQQLTYRLDHAQWSSTSHSYTAHQGHPVLMKAIEIKA